MKLDKAQLAHEMAVSMQSCEAITDMSVLAKLAWQYADAMQAEADKRSEKGVPELLTTNKDGACAHIHTTLNGGECFDCGEDLTTSNSAELEWQPDWSKAPDWANWWIKTSGKWFAWLELKPSISNLSDSWNVESGTTRHAPSFNYQGDWKDSLRKRPEGR